MKTIQISTAVFAAIWANRAENEESEDAILRRLLELKHSSKNDLEIPEGPTGYRDDRNGVVLDEGFEIFRIYKGKEVRARATKGEWLLLQTGKTYPSLHKLSTATVNHNENAWWSWYYTDDKGDRHMIDALRKK